MRQTGFPILGHEPGEHDRWNGSPAATLLAGLADDGLRPVASRVGVWRATPEQN